MGRTLGSSLLLAGAALGWGCSTSSTSTTTTTSSTLLRIDPSAFQGDLACAEGMLKSYTVTLEDLVCDADAAGVVTHQKLPTVGPIPCTEPAFYGSPPIVAAHDYQAFIDGYDRDADTLEPTATGSREMKVKGTSGVVAPQWTTTCGELTAAACTGNPDAEAFVPFRPPTLIFGGVTNELEGCVALVPVELDGGGEASIPPDASVDADSGTSMEGSAPEGGAVEGGSMVDVDEDAGSTDGSPEDGQALDGPSSDGGLE
jgi:hypothetical protein